MPHCLVAASPVSPMQVIVVDIQIFADSPYTTTPTVGVVTQQQILLNKIVLLDQTSPIALVNSLTGLPGGANAIFQQYILPPADPETQALLYSFGGVVLTYAFTLWGGATYTQNFVLSVISPTQDSSWWTWTQPATSQIPWKTAYQLAGNFLNTSSFATIQSGMLSLQEQAFTDHSTTIVATQDLSQTDSGDSLLIAFQQLTKSWGWFDGLPTDDVIGPYSKTFGYTVNAQLTDEAGNQFSLVSSLLTITVAVSSGKQAAAIGANAAQLSALATTIAGGIAGIFTFGVAAAAAAAAAAALTATAAGLQNVASDPPFPDPHFDRSVKIAYPAIDFGAELSGHPAARIVIAASKIVVLLNALSAIEGKILGAQQKKRAKASNLQRQSYQKTLATMVETFSSLYSAQEELVKLPLEKQFFGGVNQSQFAKSAKSIAVRGFAEEQSAQLIKAGFSKVEINQLSKAIGSTSFKRFVGKYKNDLGHSIRVLALAVGQGAWEAMVYARQLDGELTYSEPRGSRPGKSNV